MEFDFHSLVQQKTDNELEEIYTNRGNYDKHYFEIAKEELIRRGISLDELDKKWEKNIEENNQLLEQGKDGNPIYIFFSFAGAIVGGLLGIYAGYIYAFSKTTGLDGKIFYVYEAKTRLFGRIIFYTGIIVVIVILISKLNSATLSNVPNVAT